MFSISRGQRALNPSIKTGFGPCINRNMSHGDFCTYPAAIQHLRQMAAQTKAGNIRYPCNAELFNHLRARPIGYQHPFYPPVHPGTLRF